MTNRLTDEQLAALDEPMREMATPRYLRAEHLPLTADVVEAAPALLAEVRASRVEIARLREALTPSAGTKAAYMSEFSWKEPDFDECGGRTYRHNVVPWTVIKEFMAAIAARAALESPAP